MFGGKTRVCDESALLMFVCMSVCTFLFSSICTLMIGYAELMMVCYEKVCKVVDPNEFSEQEMEEAIRESNYIADDAIAYLFDAASYRVKEATQAKNASFKTKVSKVTQALQPGGVGVVKKVSASNIKVVPRAGGSQIKIVSQKKELVPAANSVLHDPDTNEPGLSILEPGVVSNSANESFSLNKLSASSSIFKSGVECGIHENDLDENVESGLSRALSAVLLDPVVNVSKNFSVNEDTNGIDLYDFSEPSPDEVYLKKIGTRQFVTYS